MRLKYAVAYVARLKWSCCHQLRHRTPVGSRFGNRQWTHDQYRALRVPLPAQTHRSEPSFDWEYAPVAGFGRRIL